MCPLAISPSQPARKRALSHPHSLPPSCFRVETHEYAQGERAASQFLTTTSYCGTSWNISLINKFQHELMNHALFNVSFYHNSSSIIRPHQTTIMTNTRSTRCVATVTAHRFHEVHDVSPPQTPRKASAVVNRSVRVHIQRLPVVCVP